MENIQKVSPDINEIIDRQSLANKLSLYDQSVLMWRQGMWYTKREDVIEFITEFYDWWVIPQHMLDVVDDILSQLIK